MQLNGDFDLVAARDLVDYLDALGVSDLYCSPVLQAAPASSHGYDVVDHSKINVEIGGEAAFEQLAAALAAQGMHATIDVVPNHMAIDGRANRWWWDVLENGPSSVYSDYFDIDWLGDPERSGHTVLVPVLGDRYGRVLERGEVVIEREGGSFVVHYHEHELPLSPRTYDAILAPGIEFHEALGELASEFRSLPHSGSTARQARHERKELLKDQLAVICDRDPTVAEGIESRLEKLRSDPDALDAVLRRQNYRLAYWRVAREELDYRRFFNIETLVGLRVEDDEVFSAIHSKTLSMVHKGWVNGLRVDHIDGLRDPQGYLQRLRRLAPTVYLAAEKILGEHERIPRDWPLDGTTGYDFVARINNLFVDPEGEPGLTGCYNRLTGEHPDYRQVEWAAKHQIMTDELAPELERLTRTLLAVCDAHRTQRDRTRAELRSALAEILACFPVYRTYLQPDRPVADTDERNVWAAVAAAQQRQPGIDSDLLQFVGELLLLQWPGSAETEFALAFPQLSAPVMAKGAEDTAFYRYHRLASLNEVGGDPGVIGRPVEDFYDWCAQIQDRWPQTMLALDTHDTKRSADVRARINLLSEMPEAWEAAATSWLEATDRFAPGDAPDLNIRYLFLQTLVGTWPIETERLETYMAKAVREAKVHTSWSDPDEAYEADLRQFIRASLSDTAFIRLLEHFLDEQRITELGRRVSLSQLALQLTCPGVPDIYQGSEAWDNRLVDPDNRRPVDHAAIRREWGPKAHLIAEVLGHRRLDAGAYKGFSSLTVSGPEADRVVAFARSGVVAVVPRHLVRHRSWQDTVVQLPPGKWTSLLSGASHPQGSVAVDELLADQPVAVLSG